MPGETAGTPFSASPKPAENSAYHSGDISEPVRGTARIETWGGGEKFGFSVRCQGVAGQVVSKAGMGENAIFLARNEQNVAGFETGMGADREKVTRDGPAA